MRHPATFGSVCALGLAGAARARASGVLRRCPARWLSPLPARSWQGARGAAQPPVQGKLHFVDDHFEVRGHWWLPEQSDHKVPGILKFSADDGAELELFGSLRSLLELGDRAERDAVIQVEMTQDALELSARYPRLHGQAQGKPYTLVNCFATRTSWPMFGGGGGSQTINVSRILRGAIFEPDEALEASAISFTVTYLNHWLAETGITEQWNFNENGTPLGEGIPEFTLQAFAKPDRKVTVADGRTIVLQHRVGLEGDRVDRRSVTQSFCWRIDSSAGKVSMDDALDWASDVQDLISISSLESAGFEFVRFWHPDVYYQSPEGRVLPLAIDMFARWNVRLQRPRSYRPDFLFTFEDFGGFEGIRRWMEVAEKHRSSLGRVTATRYARSMFVSDRLLNCAAALEGLDRTVTAHSNSKFKTRLTRCSTLAGEPFSQLVGDVAAWAEAVRLDRDDVAHHFGRRTRSSSIATFYLWESLYFLYILCILRLCDSPEDVFTHVREHAEYHRLARQMRSVL